MKNSVFTILMSICLSISSCAQTKENSKFPQPTGYINDFENIFTDAEEIFLDSLGMDFEARTTIEIAIVTLDSTFTTKENLENYSLELTRYWEVGKKDKDNGILICISASLKTMRIQNGYGIEKMITDEATGIIIDDHFTPEFKKGKYFEGTRNGTLELIDELL